MEGNDERKKFDDEISTFFFRVSFFFFKYIFSNIYSVCIGSPLQILSRNEDRVRREGVTEGKKKWEGGISVRYR